MHPVPPEFGVINVEVLNYYDGTVLELYDYNLDIHIPFEKSNNKIKFKKIRNHQLNNTLSAVSIPKTKVPSFYIGKVYARSIDISYIESQHSGKLALTYSMIRGTYCLLLRSFKFPIGVFLHSTSMSRCLFQRVLWGVAAVCQLTRSWTFESTYAADGLSRKSHTDNFME